MQAIIINDFRHNLAQNLAGLKPFAKIAAFAVGDGGHNKDGSVKIPNIAQTSLNNQFASKKVAKIELLDNLTLSVTCILENNEANGKIISEIALLDENDAIIGLKNIAPKHKEKDELFEITFTVRT